MAAGAADVVVRVRVLDQPPGPRSRRPQRVGFGALRALAALPAVLGGVLVALVVSGFGWVGSVLFLAWLSVGAALLTVWGERLAVRRMCRFRASSQAERQLLGPVAMMAMVRCGLPAGTVDWYVQPAPDTNACAAGRRSVAVTDKALRSFVSGRLPADQLTTNDYVNPAAGLPPQQRDLSDSDAEASDEDDVHEDDEDQQDDLAEGPDDPAQVFARYPSSGTSAPTPTRNATSAARPPTLS